MIRIAEPIDLELAYCPDCQEQWHECSCPDLPTFEQVRDNPELIQARQS